MEWTRSETVGLAKAACAHCQGYGLRVGKRGKEAPCNCVFRAIFRACYNKFVECATKEKHLSRVSLEFVPGKDRRHIYSRKVEDYMADFILVSRRHLDQFLYRVFRYHFLLGADWKLCCRQMEIDRGTFFHAVYRIQQRLGRVFRELEPYSLYPLDEYFGGVIRNFRPLEPRRPSNVIPLRAPLRKKSADLELLKAA